MNIPGHLKNLLLLNEQVILPGFGEFIITVAEHPGNFSGTLEPPTKTLRFNAAAKANDYVLARYVAERENVPASDANNAIREFVEELARQFDEFREIRIDGIGSFFLEEEGGALRFAADPAVNFNPDAFGLAPVQMKRGEAPVVDQHPKAPEDENRPDDRYLSDKVSGSDHSDTSSTNITEPGDSETAVGGIGNEVPGGLDTESGLTSPSRRKKLLYIILIILVTLFTAAWALFYLYPEQTRDIVDHVKERSNIWFSKANDVTPEPLVPEPQSIPEDAITEPGQESVAGEEAEPRDETTTAPVVKAPEATPSTGMFVINAGAFNSRTNAEQMAERLRIEGFHAATVDGQTGTGLWRVTAGFFRTEEEALGVLRKARSENKLPNAWISER